MGDGVNIAARLEGIAKPGAICLSEQAYWQVKSRLDLAVSDLGATQLKNIAEPIRVYSLEVGKPAQVKRTKPPHQRSFHFPYCWVRGSSHSSWLRAALGTSLARTDLRLSPRMHRPRSVKPPIFPS